MADNRALNVIAEAAAAIDHSRWPFRLWYLVGATTALTCTAETTEADWAGAPDVPVKVKAVTSDGIVTVEGTIHLWVTPKRG